MLWREENVIKRRERSSEDEEEGERNEKEKNLKPITTNLFTKITVHYLQEVKL